MGTEDERQERFPMPKNKGKGGKSRRRVWISQGDIVLVGLRDFQDEKADVILKYSADEARNLKAYGELPETAKINESSEAVEFGDDDDVEFDFDEIDDI